MDAAFTSQSEYARQDEWEVHRERITHLYHEKGMPLKKVMRIMKEEHSFVAKERMFKTRIKKWKLKKYIKAGDVAEMVQSKHTHDPGGLRPTLVVKDRQMEWSEVEKHLKHNPNVVIKLAKGCTLEIGHVGGVIVRTPPLHLVEAWSARSPGAPLREAGEARVPDEIIRLTRDYCIGAVENGIWIPSGLGNYQSSRGGMVAYQRLQQWGETMKLATHLIGNNKLRRGFQLLNYCLDRLSLLFKDEDPSLLLHLVQVLLGFRSFPADLREVLLQHFKALAHITWGQKHPLAFLVDRLVDLIRFNPPYLTDQMPLRWMSDSLDPCYDTRLFYVNYVSGLWTPPPDAMIQEDAILRQIVLGFQANLDPYRSMFYLTHLTQALRMMIKHTKFEQADHVIDAILYRITTTSDGAAIKVDAKWFQLFNATHLRIAMGRRNEAVSLASELYEYSVEAYGLYHRMTLEALESLWNSQAKVERTKGTDKLRKEWDAIVEKLVDLELNNSND